ncbi:MAG TPA: nucleotidyltransferase domain-containing protein [Polyangiaceae bacterium]|nr:nucleotidyltransferase domain-containing protein [Polyangiaceae bacterium]
MTKDRAPELATANALQSFQRVLHARDDVALALLFGSRARGDASETSDIDLALLAPSADLLEIGALLSQASGLEVDVSSLADPGVPLLDELLRDAVLVYEARPGAYATWHSHVLADLELDRPWYERMRDAWLARVAQRGL